jgi:CRP-like cAMP-binding protein
MKLVRFLDLTFVRRTRGNAGTNVKSSALARGQCNTNNIAASGLGKPADMAPRWPARSVPPPTPPIQLACDGLAKQILPADLRAVTVVGAEQFRQMAFWSTELTESEFERARRGTVERAYAKGSYVCHRGDQLDAWIGVIEGLLKLGTVSETGKDVTLAGLRAGGWFGEGSVLKDEPRQYDLAVLRDTRLAFMNRATFIWLFENSVGFNRFLVRQFNERLGQFIALVEYDRTLNATARLARSIAWLFNPVLYPQGSNYLEISQEEVGLLSGISRPAANEALKALEARGLIRVERMGIAVRDLSGLLRQRE